MYLDMSQEPPSAKGSHKVHPQRLETHFLMVICTLIHLPAKWVQSMGREMASHSSILACKIPWTEEPDGLQSIES